MSALLTHLMKLKILSSAQCDKINAQFLEFLDDELKINVEIFQSFSCDETALDDFFFKLVGMEKYKDLSFLLKIVLTLSHGQPAVERSFSLGNALLNYEWLSLLHNFIQLSLNSDSAQVQTLLTACWRFAMVRISDNGPCWK